MSETAKAIQDLSKTGDELYGKVCKVTAVDIESKTCDLEPVDGTGELFDVPWSPDTEEDGMLLQPKEGSMVLVVFIDKHHAQICNVSELDKMHLTIGTVEFKVDASGFMLKKENENLKLLMGDLLTAIKAMKFTTNAGPTIALINLADFEALEPRFDNLLKDV